MKKFVFPLTLIVIAALLLAACGSTAGTTGNVTPGAGTESTPAVEVTGGITPEATNAIGDTTPTVEATAEATTAATAEATSAATKEVTAEATAASTPSGTATVEATPATGTGSTGGTTGGTVAEGQYVRLSTLLTAKVSTNDSQPAGEVDGVLVEHPVPPPAAAEGGASAAATPEATATSATPDEKTQEFTIRYVLVDTSTAKTATNSSGGHIAVIPWQAFDMASMASGSTLTLNVASSALASVPLMRLSEIASPGGNWAGDVATFWSGQGVAGIPNTGAAGGINTENLALIPREFRGITISDQQGAALGNIADFLIDPSTGVVVSAVFNGGEAFGSKSFAVPMTHLTWSGNIGTQLGTFQFNFPNDVLKNAPSFDSLQNLNLNQDWSTQFNQFWNSIQGTSK